MTFRVRQLPFRRRERGQVMVETALVLPLLLFLSFGVIQLGMLGYASIVARYAAFHGLRAAALEDSGDREEKAKNRALMAVVACPILRLAGMELKTESMRGPSGDRTSRMRMTVRIAVPCLVPLVKIRAVDGTCVMPMEPIDWERR